jgi:hypothetical protein
MTVKRSAAGTTRTTRTGTTITHAEDIATSTVTASTPTSSSAPSTPDRLHLYESGSRRYLPSSVKRSLAGKRYHPDDFHVAVSDDNGNSEKVWLRLHPMALNEVGMVISRRLLPFQNSQQFFRWAVNEGLLLCYYLEREGGIQDYTAHLNAINAIAAQVEQQLQFEKTHATVRQNANRLISAGKESMAAMFVWEVLDKLKNIPQKELREWYVAEIQREYGPLLKKMKKSVKVKTRRTHDDE